mgnify:FL=1|jgi:hypothetical protein|tara:strand:- start:5171 stop:5293 length:123 start_codon:yes stop_codon:yes gene_type:complete
MIRYFFDEDSILIKNYRYIYKNQLSIDKQAKSIIERINGI